jgi:hypothetical protein
MARISASQQRISYNTGALHATTACDNGVCRAEPHSAEPETDPSSPLPPAPGTSRTSRCASMTTGLAITGVALGTACALGQADAVGSILTLWLQWALHLIA